MNLVEVFSNHFDALVSNLNFKVPENMFSLHGNIGDLTTAAINKYQNHLSIIQVLKSSKY